MVLLCINLFPLLAIGCNTSPEIINIFKANYDTEHRKRTEIMYSNEMKLK